MSEQNAPVTRERRAEKRPARLTLLIVYLALK